jgi:hypothetical protein
MCRAHDRVGRGLRAVARMACGLLLLSTMSGCIFFAPPTEESTVSADRRPVLVADETTLQNQPFGPAGPFTPTQALDLKIAAEDPDIGDTLTARLYKLVSGAGVDGGVSTARLWLNFEIPLSLPSPPSVDHPTRRYGEFTSLECGLLGPSPNTVLYLIVADRAFSDLQPDQVQPGGLSDENHWELNCL